MTEEDLVIVGAGFAGLSAAWFARRRGVDPLILDRSDGPGGLWRRVNPAMRCLSPRHYDRLPDGTTPAGPGPIAMAAEVQQALERFGQGQGFRARFGVDVLSVDDDGTFVLGTESGSIRAKRLLVASGVAGAPRPAPPGGGPVMIPALALHRRLDEVGETALVIGAGNSGADAVETLLAAGRTVVLSSRRPLASQPPYPSGLRGRVHWKISGLPVRWLPPRLRCHDPVLPVHDRLSQELRRGQLRFVGETLSLQEDGAQCRAEPGASTTCSVSVHAVILAHGFQRDISWLGMPPGPRLALLGLDCQRTRRSGFLRGLRGDAAAEVDRLLAPGRR